MRKDIALVNYLALANTSLNLSLSYWFWWAV